MTIRELKNEIRRLEQEYGPSVRDWDVYTEQCTESDKEQKRDPAKQGWDIIDHSSYLEVLEPWEYFKVEALGLSVLTKERVITIDVNY